MHSGTASPPITGTPWLCATYHEQIDEVFNLTIGPRPEAKAAPCSKCYDLRAALPKKYLGRGHRQP